MVRSAVDVRALQAPLRERYQVVADEARIELVATSALSDLADPLHCAVSLPASGDTVLAGAHPLVGGTGDVPCSGDLLLAALAACQETTLRMVAANMGVDLVAVDVRVTSNWDARGTLAFKEAPIGIKRIRCETRVVVAGDERGERADRLLRSAEKYCVILDTLRAGVTVESTFALEQAADR